MGFGDEQQILSGHGGIGQPIGDAPALRGLETVTCLVVLSVALDVGVPVGEHQDRDRGIEDTGLAFGEPVGGAQRIEGRDDLGAHQEMNALGEAGRWGSASQVAPVEDRVGTESIVFAGDREATGHAPSGDHRRHTGRILRMASGQVRRPNLARSSAIVQPWTISTPPAASDTPTNNERMSAGILSGLADSWSRNPERPFLATMNVFSS